jgi:hypothetical protein
MAELAHGDPTSKGKKYDLPGMQDPSTVPTSKALELSEKSVTITRKNVAPRKIRRIV